MIIRVVQHLIQRKEARALKCSGSNTIPSEYRYIFVHLSIMARLVLGKIEFEVDPDCEELDARCYAVPDADVVALGERMALGDFGRLKALDLVSCSAFVAFFAWC